MSNAEQKEETNPETEEEKLERQKKQHESIGEYFLTKTRAFGKLILFGEHFVVYHVPALVAAVAAYTDCQVELLEKEEGEENVEIVDHRPAVPLYKVKKRQEGQEAVQLVLNHLNANPPPEKRLKLTFGGTLTCVSGIGASAAQVVALARALNLHDCRAMTEDEINAAGYEGERGYHGTPSGIDNTAATFGGLLKFQRRPEQSPLFEKKQLKTSIRIVYASTGLTSSTTQVVGDVRAKKEADPVWFDGLLKRYTDLVAKAEVAIDACDWSKLGEYMNENHVLCQELTVSCPELDQLVEAARAAGAVGAKMSGTGRGGLMVALTPTVELQTQVAAALEKAGAPQVWKTEFA